MAKTKPPPKPTQPPEIRIKPGERFICGTFVRWARESGINPDQAKKILNSLIKSGKVVEVSGGCGMDGETKIFEAVKD